MKILDNTDGKTVMDWLKGNMQPEDTLRFVSAYFSIYGYEALQEQLDTAKMRFLFGDPANVGNVDPTSQQEKSFALKESKLKLRSDNPLTQKWIAQRCEKWVLREDTEIRTVQQAGFLHGKMYHLQHGESEGVAAQAISGSSNFTKNGLGAAKNSNLELNLIADAPATEELAEWFDALWNDKEKITDAKPAVLEALRKLGADQTPQFIYYKTLYHLFEDRLRFMEENEGMMGSIPYDKSVIWQKLYEFQKRGAIGAINRLQNHNGCIIADSVGLGKTYSALAVIKYFELRNENVLVLCPKRLSDNWTRYQAASADQSNPFAEDKFQYHVLSHTDLGRDSGMVGGINLANINWGNYSLVVIDESHNFRNAPSASKKDDPTARRSRYKFLLDEVIKAGVPTKVLMLSATPVNNRLQDLRNQILLFSGGNDNHFNADLEIPSLRQVMQNAQRQFAKWQELPAHLRSKENLLNALDEQFYRILDAVTLARSRHHLKSFYPEFADGFPRKNKPRNEQPPTDNKNELQYANMADRIEELKLAIYSPSDYLAGDSDLNDKLAEEKKELHYNQKDREHLLIGIMRTNFLKRLESSVAAYRETIGRILLKIDMVLEKIAAHQGRDAEISDGDTEPDGTDMEDEENYIVGGKKWQYKLTDLDLPKWQADLEADKAALQAILDIAERVTPERDEKLAVLRAAIADKIATPTTDKDGKQNRKVLIFTTFADTAKYLYRELHEEVQKQGRHIGQIAGSGDVRSSIGGGRGKADYAEILDRFAPHGRDFTRGGDNIDILIATDCISEGQNLQDCDLVINYDVHWNPVRIIQRFGRIDRLNSRNETLSMINFWPDMELEKYLALQRRVLTRMELANIAATGHDNLLTTEETPPDDPNADKKEGEQMDLALDHRAAQMRRLQDEVLDTEQQQSEMELSDFTLDDFLADLRAYMEKTGEALKSAPLGLFSLAPPHESGDSGKQHAPGIVFCLRRKSSDKKESDKLPPCHLVYIKDDNTAASLGNHALTVLRGLARDRSEVQNKLARWFDTKTNNGQNMAEENKHITAAIKAITERERKGEAGNVSGGGMFGKRGERAQSADDYELVTWLITRPENTKSPK